MRTARRTGKCPLTWDDAVAEAAADLGREGIWRMRASQDLRRVSMSVDEPNLVSHAGLVAVAELAQWLGVAERIDAHLDLSGTPGQANEGTKAMTVLGGLLAGADSIDDVAVLRTGALPQPFVTRAPSTIGTFLRSFTFGHVRQLDAVARELLGAAWAAGAGPAPGTDVFVDVDSTICEVSGVGKQGAAFGYTKVRGYHPLLATCAGDAAGGGARQLLGARLRGGNAASGRGAGNFVTETLSRLRAALPVDAGGRRGRVTLRADAGFYSRAVVRACRAADARFSLTVRMNPALRAAIAGIRTTGGRRSRTGPPTASSATTRTAPRSPARTSPRSRTPPSPGPRTRSTCGWWCAGCGPRPARSWRWSRCSTTTRSSPTGPVSCSPSRPSTATTPLSSRSSPTSRAPPGWPTCPPAGSPRTPPGSAWSVWPTTWPAGPRR